MITLATLQFLVRFISAILAYFMIVPVAGYVRAWVAKQMGDNSAEESGVLTLDPAEHIDLIGFIMLLFLGVGWGKQIPINPHNIQGRWRWLKITAAYYSDAVACIVLAALMLVGLIALFGAPILFVVFSDHVPQVLLNDPHLASWRIALFSVARVFILLNSFLAMISIVINTAYLCITYFIERRPELMQQFYTLITFLPLILLLLFGGLIERYIVQYIILLGFAIAHLLGLA